MSSFFARTTATRLWKCMTGVSAAGRKRGRKSGTDRVLVKDYNRGQEIGQGRKKLVMPGLNANLTKGSDIQDLGKNEQYTEKIAKIRSQMNTYRKFRAHPLERGWCGRGASGQTAGSPDEHNETPFEGFDSTVLMLKTLTSMTSLGRARRQQALVVTGNGNGLAGFSTAIGNDARSVVRHARNKAGQALVQVPRWEEHTVMHDFYSKYYDTTVFVQRKPKGFGIRAHRVIKAICDAFGIKDLVATIQGSKSNQINITKAFFLGLMNQRKYEDMAEEKQLHLVELQEQNFYFPRILASPKSRVRDDSEIKNTKENLDFTYYIYDGKIRLAQQKPRNPFEDGPTWHKYLNRLDYEKNREKTKLLLAAKYGDRRVKDVFPYFKTTCRSFKEEAE